MFDKILVSKEIIKFMCDKVGSFICDYYNNRINEKRERKAQLSTTQFEREFRNDLQQLEFKVDNMEALIYQSRQLFENSIKNLSDQTDFIKIENLNIFGDVCVTINYNVGEVYINKDLNVITGEHIRKIVNIEAEKMFQVEQAVSECKIPLSNKKSDILRIVRKGECKIRELREDD